MTSLILALVTLLSTFSVDPESTSSSQNEPVKIAVAGLTHDHVHWIFGRDNSRNDIEVVGIYEPNEELWQRYMEMYDLDQNLHFDDLFDMLNETHPEAITAFGSTYDHLQLVETAAPLGVHVMVEKPLAVNLDHALRMKKLADENDIHLITNYETTWYSSNQEVKRLFEHDKGFGKIRKVTVNDGHQGPKEIGVSEEFLEWLTDPVLNGGGAIMDFGCYGANLITWLMDGQEPTSVTAVTQTHKPGIYPHVDDEATIILTYPGVQGVIQASWNWPYNRKDMQVYGEHGYAFAQDNQNLQILKRADESPENISIDPREYPYNDPFSYLAAVVNDDITVQETDLSSLSNNITVMKILDAAKKSAETGKTITLTP
ncbi:Gfo/Idh/MocA family protein [Rhodohalobacter sulfatireducens]|uniref:Gfo/Idh/MocA family oxidoreductase n=1 Tax=Rhodohalobacter sulfatireducens TaxID=2911366 RepID=A0ABS9KFW6_9BACT|nr:Gfo/Idh/MocA family oxidoreductase [Rhodohalobacter sulfatireducens]MCG2589741.1 Gfo/Idh/MocA family oxidoreductase [Rhodohalobacter sulfatireducens]